MNLELAECLEGNFAEEFDSLGVVPINGQIDRDAVDSQCNGFCDLLADAIGITKDQGFADHVHDPIIPTLDACDLREVGVGLFHRRRDDDHQ